MKRILLTLVLLLAGLPVCAQSEYNLQKRSLFNVLPVRSGDIVFLGDSITDGGEWAELFDNRHIKNRGISGDRSGWLLDRLDSIIAGRPKRLFLMIGINDLAADVAPAAIVANIRTLIDRFQKESPWTRIFVQSLLPVNGERFQKYGRHYAHRSEIIPTNRMIEDLCIEKQVVYIDLWKELADSQGLLDARYTNDGLHLTGAGYLVWRDALVKYVR